MRKLFIGLPYIIIGFVSFSAFAQEELPTTIQTFFDTYQNEYPVEKAYLHLDKHTYTLGDDIWFSAYLTAGSSQLPSPLSRTLYVDLFDGEGLLLGQKIVQLENGRGRGDFKLAQFGTPGNYRIKAYTSWMKNFGEEYFFTAEINVADGAGGSFLPKITYNKISNAGGKVTYQATLIVTDSKAVALGGETIQIKAATGDEVVYDQSLALNTQGEVSFTFSIPEKANDSQHLELTYMENENYAVTQKLRLPYSLSMADIQFLPEGGHSVVGKKSNFAFRAIYPDGMPADIRGTIEGSELSFESNFAGLGKFELIPTQANYQAKITDKTTGEEITVDLPMINAEGLVMQVVNNPEANYVTVFVQGTYEPNSLLLISQTRGIINYMIKGALSNEAWGVRIPKENLISGINQITVMSSDGKPLLERLLFIKKVDQLQLDLSKVGDISPREKIKLDLKSTFSENPSPGSFSIAVLDAAQVDENDLLAGNIYSSLLLNSDLAGGIYQPGKYFTENAVDTDAALDLVMLTHGWRRFSWEDVLSAKYPDITHFIEQGINMEGQVTDSGDTRKGLAGGIITALVGEGIEMISTEFGPNGRFLFRDLNYLDSASVTITAEDNRLKNFVEISLIQPEPVFSEIAGKYSDNPFWSDELAATYQTRSRMNQLIYGQEKLLDLEEVTVQGSTIQEEENQIRKIYGAGDVTIDPENIPATVGFTNIFQLIQGRVAGVQVSLAGQNVGVIIRGVGTLGGASTEPLYILDNVPVQATTLLNVNPREVASIDVFKDPASTAIFGVQGANGVIAVYTKTGAGVERSVGGTLVTRYGGYAVPREFYLPKYDTKTVENAITDARSTIYWNPLVQVGETGETSLEFFNSDLAEKQVIIIEGMDANGRLGRLVKILD